MDNKYCVMTWKTFLDLFKKDYSLFYFDGINWYFNTTYIKIILHYTNDIVPDEEVIFINPEEIGYGRI